MIAIFMRATGQVKSLTVGLPELDRRIVAARAILGLSIGGYLIDADREQIQGSDFVMAERIGRGRVILFGEEPNLRCQWPVLHRLLFNAMLVGGAVN